MFHSTAVNDAGCYIVYFYVNGKRTPTLIDDYLPVSLSKPSCMWACLLEKAWAKLHGSYAKAH
jgi:hypothetical protein